MVSGSSTYHALDCRTVAEIRNKVMKQSGRNAASRLFHARNDKEIIAAWKSELNRILIVFNVCSARSCLVALTDPSSDRADHEHPYNSCRCASEHVLKIREDADSQNRVVSDTRAL
jgi:hypothetical protein